MNNQAIYNELLNIFPIAERGAKDGKWEDLEYNTLALKGGGLYLMLTDEGVVLSITASQKGADKITSMANLFGLKQWESGEQYSYGSCRYIGAYIPSVKIGKQLADIMLPLFQKKG
ncbi:hypothetical protein J8L86_17610 [Shewanella sp. MMG014]|uniref:hypothetical protein n=1 Tax=Shewanella sp. MMG014 TaxID=2822691 RepID=UPI001B39B70A|nr:hypothetical protein [Shewanella sp. MMG014]MBQ4891668.1 hypothetical protein [Shewanella sp. MMG014]